MTLFSKIWFAYFSASYVFIPQFSFASSDHCSVLNTFDQSFKICFLNKHLSKPPLWKMPPTLPIMLFMLPPASILPKLVYLLYWG